MSTENLIRRARELAHLGDMVHAPWNFVEDEGRLELRDADGDLLIDEAYRLMSDQQRQLIAAAPEMARLLAELADALERSTSE